MIAGLLAISIIAAAGEPTKFVATDVSPHAEFSLFRVGSERPVFAAVKREGEKLFLTPTYPLSPGEVYEARISEGGKVIERYQYRLLKPESDPPRVARILPDSGIVPANLLKFYLELDQPVKEGRSIFDQIHIVDENGEKVHSPWRRQELWSNDGRRLTLWIHPGRVKQGVNLREQLGPVLEPEKKYELLIDGDLESAAGKKLGKPYRHPFTTGPEVRQYIDVAKWQISPPDSPRGDLVIEASRSLDPFLVQRHVRISRGEETIDASVKWDKTQRKYRFSRPDAWQPGKYRIEVGEYLEDLAGNTVARIFDTDLSQSAEKPSLPVRYFVIPE